MCGIISYIGTKPAVPMLMEGLTILQNRGYDSAGIASLSQEATMTVSKFASESSTSDALERLTRETEKHQHDSVGIAHTRWATHGAKTDINAHPHCDTKKRIALVHNGVIENCHILRKELEENGIMFQSETDTEVIAQLIGHYLDENMPLLGAVNKTLSRLQGTWGLVIMAQDQPDQLIAARNGSPVVVGIAQHGYLVASEPAAFYTETREFITLQNGEIAVLKRNGELALDINRIEHTPELDLELSPAPYEHWTLKEIMEQPESIKRALNFGGRIQSEEQVKLGGIEAKQDHLLQIRHQLISACGTAGFAGEYGAYLMRHLHAFETVRCIDASEFSRDDIPSHGGGLLLISQSGETKDVSRAMHIGQQEDIPVYSAINAVGSHIARSTECGVYLNAGRENGVASTKAFINQSTVLALIASWFSGHRNTHPARRRELIASLQQLSPAVKTALELRPRCADIAQTLKDCEHMFVLGKGLAFPIALESALKIKEISYIHTEGYSGGALKHGPYALIEEGTPIILFVLDDKHAHFMRTAAQEVRSRGAKTIVVTDKRSLADDIADEIIEIPHCGTLTSLVGVIPMQLLAYELSLARGINPDKPRNLAKAVTVD